MELVTGAMGTLLPKLRELLSEEHNLRKYARRDLDCFRAEMEVMEAFLVKVADVPPDRLDEQVRIWANEVRELSYVLEDSIDRLMLSFIGDDSNPAGFLEKIKMSLGRLHKLKARRRAGVEMKYLNDRLQELAVLRDKYNKAEDLRVVDNLSATTTVDPRLFSLYADQTELVGVQEAGDKIIKRLMPDGGNIQHQLKILSIVGSGGVGKTTLSKSVYDRLRTKFDCTAFISVGLNPGLTRVFKDIMLQIDKEKYSDFSTEATVQMCIEEITYLLTNKRYFLIFDDIWDIQAWEIIRCTLVESNIGSIVITTTRIYDVALNAGHVYKLEPLSHDNSEELFYKRLFGSKVKLPDEQAQLIQKLPDEQAQLIQKLPDEQAQLIQKFPDEQAQLIQKLPDEQAQLIQKLLQKCGGVPLAIITIANLLSSTRKEDWYKVYNSTSFGLANGNDIENLRNILLLSYYDLPIYLRACLLHLRIFPEDYIVRKDALIWMWVAEGFIQEESGVGLFEIGERYFHELINRGLIQPVKISHGDGIIGCRVHDLILDMICFIAQKESFVTILNSNEQQHTSMKFKARRLALHKEFMEEQCLQANTDMSQVRSFNAFMCHTTMIPSLGRFQVLRVLAIEDCSFQPEGNAYSLELIGKLLHLRYLGLQKTRVRELPKGVGKLKYLEVLDLRQTGIPKLLKSVSLLRRLKCLRADGGSTKVPDWIGSLTSLEELSLNDVSSCPNFVKEVSKLTELRDLKVWIRWLDERSKKALVKSLGNLQKIQVLHLDGGLWMEDAEWEGYVPPRQLRCLSLRTKSSRLPRWIKDSFLPNLSHLSVDVRVVEAEDLTILGSFPVLMTLELFVPNSVSLLFEGHPGSAFSQLRHCYTSGMLRFLQGAAPRLESVHFNVRLSALNGASFQCGFLGNLPLLTEVRVEIFHSDVEVYRAKEVEEALMLAVAVHGNRPTLHVSKFELSFNEDTEKEEDDIELEEEDEEDW